MYWAVLIFVVAHPPFDSPCVWHGGKYFGQNSLFLSPILILFSSSFSDICLFLPPPPEGRYRPKYLPLVWSGFVAVYFCLSGFSGYYVCIWVCVCVNGWLPVQCVEVLSVWVGLFMSVHICLCVWACLWVCVCLSLCVSVCLYFCLSVWETVDGSCRFSDVTSFRSFRLFGLRWRENSCAAKFFQPSLTQIFWHRNGFRPRETCVDRKRSARKVKCELFIQKCENLSIFANFS